MLELALRVINSYGPRSLTGEQDRPLCGAAELEHVLTGHFAEHTELALRELPHTPTRLRTPDVLTMPVLVFVRLAVPEVPVPGCVRQALNRKTRALSRAPPTPASPSHAPGCPAWQAQGRHEWFRGPLRPDSWRQWWRERRRSRTLPPPRARASGPT